MIAVRSSPSVKAETEINRTATSLNNLIETTIVDLNNCYRTGVKCLQDVCYHFVISTLNRFVNLSVVQTAQSLGCVVGFNCP